MKLSIKAKLMAVNGVIAVCVAMMYIFSSFAFSDLVDLSKRSFAASKASTFLSTAQLNTKLVENDINKILLGEPPHLDDLAMGIDAVEEDILNFSGESALFSDLEILAEKLEVFWNDSLRPELDGLMEDADNGASPEDLKAKSESIVTGLESLNEMFVETHDSISPIFENAFLESLRYRNLELILGTGLMLLTFAVIILALVHFNGVSSSLLKLAGKMKITSDTVRLQSNELKATSGKVSTASTETASSIQETVATLAEIKAMMNKALNFVGDTRTKSVESEEHAREGLGEINNLSEAINNISKIQQDLNDKINLTTERVNEIKAIFEAIKGKTDIINDIVFQTKLLSFNASVEAARAGDHGKGFAIVAEEVGNLAKMSGASSKEIADILSSSSQKVDNIVRDINQDIRQVIDEGNEKVSTGIHLSELCREKLKFVSDNISEVKGMMNDVELTAKEQSEGVDNITIAMQEIDDATHVNNDAANQTSLGSDVLDEKSNELSAVVDSLFTLIMGSKNQNIDLEEEDTLADENATPVIKTNVTAAALSQPPSADDFDEDDSHDDERVAS